MKNKSSKKYSTFLVNNDTNNNMQILGLRMVIKLYITKIQKKEKEKENKK